MATFSGSSILSDPCLRHIQKRRKVHQILRVRRDRRHNSLFPKVLSDPLQLQPLPCSRRSCGELRLDGTRTGYRRTDQICMLLRPRTQCFGLPYMYHCGETTDGTEVDENNNKIILSFIVRLAIISQAFFTRFDESPSQRLSSPASSPCTSRKDISGGDD